MGQAAVVYKSWEGGWSIDPKLGIKNSFDYSQGFDFRKKPSQLTPLPRLAREDNGVVQGLLQNAVMTNDGSIYAMDDDGILYKRTTGGVWSAEANTLALGAYGMDYRKDTDSIYLANSKSVSLYSTVSTGGAMNPGYYGESYSTSNNSDTVGFNVNAYQTGGSSTYTLATAISETPTSLRYFQSDIEPLSKISIFVINKGTGDWTLTLHDGLNNVLATSTITNANLTNGVFNDFIFSSQVRIYVTPNARTYHLHVTSTVADGTLQASTLNDLSTCDLQIWADRLVNTNNGMHPMARFFQYEVIGNGNYVSIWEPISDVPTNSEWLRHKLTFPQEYEVCGLAATNEFLAIALEKNTTGSSTPQEGIIAFWDGTNPTYNYFVRIPEGSPYCLHEYKNVIYYFAGGAWYTMSSPLTEPVKIRTMPGTDTEFSNAAAPFRIYPYAATVRRGIHLFGFPSTTTDTSVNFGVYSYGSVDRNLAPSFGYSYVLSTGTMNYTPSNNLTIGMVKNFGDTLLVSWRDSLQGGYGVDSVTNSSAPAATAVFRSLIFDNGMVFREKQGLYMYATFASLPADASFKIGYSLNRGAFQYSDIQTAATILASQGDVYHYRFDINKRFYEIQVELQVFSATNVSTVTSVGFVFEDLKDEMLA